MDETGKQQRDAGERWWQDWRWIAAAAGLLFAVAFSAFTTVAVSTHATTERTNDTVADLEPIIERLDSNQAGIDSLVSFVEDVNESRAESDPFDAQVFIDLLCASDDPVRLEACDRLRAGS